MLGVGPGSLPTDGAMIGISQSQTRGLEEGLGVIMKLLTSGEPVTFKNDRWDLRDARLHFSGLGQRCGKLGALTRNGYFARFPHPGNLPRASRFSSPEPSTNLAVIGTTAARPLSRGVVSARSRLLHSDSGTAPLFHIQNAG